LGDPVASLTILRGYVVQDPAGLANCMLFRLAAMPLARICAIMAGRFVKVGFR
jgi:hypothetical protein